VATTIVLSALGFALAWCVLPLRRRRRFQR
jgi:hypothetical protein